ncbi:uncharacterized protein N7515_004170 [Penicillium bovifimosum]|uniref:GPI anchored cell wall protein n=1 Tax=Penicillium bovifimosum TaxID=126998 RepID=A0A9W9H604_9EURO|nr:uncharacterized protein N7515_004170 [Penicillium bovifimosum]KAJ5139322.1 hypothetical protein N7515_004170 [Penicillium bovifimosum]
MRVASILTMAALAAAETTTTIGFLGADFVDITIPSYTSIAASITGINALATTYVVKCLKDAPKSDCHIEDPWTIIQGQNTMSLTGVYTAWSTGDVNAVTATRDIQCSFTAISESVSCSISYQMTGTVNGMSTSTSTSTSTKTIPTDKITYYGLAVTGGIESFTATEATHTPSGAAGAQKPLITAAPMGVAAALGLAALL